MSRIEGLRQSGKESEMSKSAFGNLLILAFGNLVGGAVAWTEAPVWKQPARVSYEDPSLKNKSLAMDGKFFSSIELTQLTEALAKEMFSNFGILGIAAPQMGVDLRIFLLRSSSFNFFSRSYKVFINPLMSPVGDSASSNLEFCLSTRGFHWTKRFKTIQLEFNKVDGAREVIELTGWRARVVQHEIDHLDGKLISEE